MKDYRLSEIKAICEKNEECKTCPFSEEWFNQALQTKVHSCTVCFDCEMPNNWQIDKDETKKQLIADLNKVAMRMNWGTVERTINDDGTNGMPYMIDVIARTIAYLKGESEDDKNNQ